MTSVKEKQVVDMNGISQSPIENIENEKEVLLSEMDQYINSNEKVVPDKQNAPPIIEMIHTVPKENSGTRKSMFNHNSMNLDEKGFKWLEKFLDSPFFQILINGMTIYALFADDFRTAFLPKSVDNAIDGITVGCMAIFTFEIITSVLTKEKYFNSFFFWLDIISTISLVFDLKWFQSAILVNPQATNSTQLARASRASRIGTRAGRLIRLVRIVKLYKAFKTRKALIATKNSTISPSKQSPKLLVHESKTNSVLTKDASIIRDSKETISNISNIEEDDDLDFDPTKESRVGKKLSDLTTKRVIIMILILIVITPVFSADYWIDPILAFEYGMIELKNFADNGPSTKYSNARMVKIYDAYIEYNRDLTRYPLIYFKYPPMTNIPGKTVEWKSGSDVSDLRDDEVRKLYQNLNKYDEMLAILDFRESTRTTAIINIVRTIYISIILTMGALCFSNDANILAIRPIERMIEKVKKIAMNPLSSKDVHFVRNKDAQQYETTMIENAIVKIGTLLALGFGDAGSEIVAQNMSQGGDVNPMIPGKRKSAIFGFCDIRNFTDSTEVLQEEVMVFVNQIGDYVHRLVDRYQGAANKNIGDAFLLVWKVPDGEINEKNNTKASRKLKNICDLSLMSFIKIIAAINKKPSILKYRENEGLNERIPQYKVKMGFGLHIGWAIEGAIGSIFKIDASYLSPNVNMAARLEAATKQYGVPLLISSDLHSKFSKRIRNLCREIDRVTVKGSVKPIGLFTFDSDISEVRPSAENFSSKKENALKHKLKKTEIFDRFINGFEKSNSLLDTDKDLGLLSKACTTPVVNAFREVFSTYIQGDWPSCKQGLENCLNLNPIDGPTNALYNVIKGSQFMAPGNWKGYRELTEK